MKYHRLINLRKNLIIFILLLALVASTGCISSKIELRSVDITRPSETEAETEEVTEEAEKDKKKDKERQVLEARASKEKAVQYDFSKEYNVGNLQAYVANTATQFAASENGPETAGLKQLVESFLARKGVNPGQISIIYQDLGTGLRYSHNPDARYQAASVIKTAMGMVVAQLIDEGVFPPDMQIAYVPGEQFASEDMDASRLGSLVSMSELLNSAIIYSGNAPTSAVFEYFKRHGRDLHFFMDERTGTNYSGDVSMSAREGIGLVTQLYFDSRYPSYQSVIQAMTSSTWGSFLTGGIPVAVSSKYGNVGGLNHEIGIVWADRPFAYSVFSSNIPAYDVLPELGALLYNYHTGAVTAPPGAEAPAGSAADPAFADGAETANPSSPPPVGP